MFDTLTLFLLQNWWEMILPWVAKICTFASGKRFRTILVTVSVSPTCVKCGSTEITGHWYICMRLLLIFWWEVIFLYRWNAGDPGNTYFANCGRPCWVPTFLHICSSTFCVPCYEHLSSKCWSHTSWRSQSKTSEAGLLQRQYLQYLSFPGTSIGEVGKVLWQDVLQAWHTIKKQKGTQFRSLLIT